MRGGEGGGGTGGVCQWDTSPSYGRNRSGGKDGKEWVNTYFSLRVGVVDPGGSPSHRRSITLGATVLLVDGSVPSQYSLVLESVLNSVRLWCCNRFRTSDLGHVVVQDLDLVGGLGLPSPAPGPSSPTVSL